jgi:hypothetical protein
MYSLSEKVAPKTFIEDKSEAYIYVFASER